MPCTSIPDPQSCLRKMLKMNFMIVIMCLGYDQWWLIFDIFSSKVTLVKQEDPSSVQTLKPFLLFFEVCSYQPTGFDCTAIGSSFGHTFPPPKAFDARQIHQVQVWQIWFWMILGETNTLVPKCRHVNHMFLPPSSESFCIWSKSVLSFSGLFGAATRQWTMHWLTLANRWHPKRWCRAALLPFIGFQSIWIWIIQNPILQKTLHWPSTIKSVNLRMFCQAFGHIVLPFAAIWHVGPMGWQGERGLTPCTIQRTIFQSTSCRAQSSLKVFCPDHVCTWVSWIYDMIHLLLNHNNVNMKFRQELHDNLYNIIINYNIICNIIFIDKNRNSLSLWMAIVSRWCL